MPEASLERWSSTEGDVTGTGLLEFDAEETSLD